MMLDPNSRYQSPGNMLTDLKIATRRLAETGASKTTTKSRNSTLLKSSSHAEEADATTLPAEEQPSVMVVESNAQMQDIFRQGFKRAGYRVLLTSDPNRALYRFRQEVNGPADCVVLNAQELGESALEVFNKFAGDTRTDYVPAVLLLGETQQDWQDMADTDDHRIVMSMPVTMRQLRTKLAKLVALKTGG